MASTCNAGPSAGESEARRSINFVCLPHISCSRLSLLFLLFPSEASMPAHIHIQTLFVSSLRLIPLLKHTEEPRAHTTTHTTTSIHEDTYTNKQKQRRIPTDTQAQKHMMSGEKEIWTTGVVRLTWLHRPHQRSVAKTMTRRSDATMKGQVYKNAVDTERQARLQ